MARQGLQVIDIDAHYLEPIEEITDYMDEPWRSRAKSVGSNRLLPTSLGDRMVEGRIQRDDVAYGKVDQFTYGQGVMVPKQISSVMQRIGVDASIVVGNRLLLFGHMSVRDMAVAFANGYIDYMLDKVASPADGVYTMPIVPWQDPEAAAEMVDRVGGHPGVVGVCFTTSGANPPLGDVRYNPIYEAAQHHNLPIVYHSAPALTLTEGSSYQDGLQRLIEAHSLGFLISNQIQLTSVIMQGVPERYPRLKFVFQESGLFWLPSLMYRLDEYYLKRRSEAPLLKALPSEYILDRFYLGTQPIEAPRNQKHLEAVFDMCNGRQNFMFASDYPHFDYDDPSSILRLSFLSRQDKANVLSENAKRIFNFRKGGEQAWESTSSLESERSQKVKADS